MRLPSIAFIAVLAVLLSATAVPAGARTRTHYLELINRAPDSIRSLAIAPAGNGEAFEEKTLGTPLRGGGDSATVEIAGEDCNYDLRFVFRDGRTLIYQDVDICRHPRVHVQRMPRAGEKGRGTSLRYADADTP